MIDKSQLGKRIVQLATLEGDFLLRSGARSNIYFDKYIFESDPKILNQLTLAMCDLLPQDVDALAGLEMGGIPLATMLAQHTGLHTRFVRKEAKEYGTCNLAEGGPIDGLKLVIVEDVVTSGGQVIESVRELRARGATVEEVLCVIDREAGGEENLAKEGLTLRPLFKRSELEENK